MSHIYNNTFFDYIDESAHASAEELIGLLYPMLKPQSVLDLGSGRGTWLAQWRRAGAAEVMGVDGDYVDQSNLAVDQAEFKAADLTKPVKMRKRYDLAQSLEVGEHLPLSAAPVLVDSLTSASDRVLFSAAVKGQGGEFHVNEQPLSFWQELFEAKGYRAFDCLRPSMRGNRKIAPWYRYNSILYVNVDGMAGLPDEVLRTAVPTSHKVQDGGDALWKLRRSVVSHLPRDTVTKIAQVRASVLAQIYRKRPTGA